jgi:hypothetical protein
MVGMGLVTIEIKRLRRVTQPLQTTLTATRLHFFVLRFLE